MKVIKRMRSFLYIYIYYAIREETVVVCCACCIKVLYYDDRYFIVGLYYID
jgi:hypothetical protein